MSFYSDIAADVELLIQEFGQSLTFTRETPGEYDPALSTVTASIATWIAQVVVQPASAGTVQAFDVRFEAGTMIETNLRSLLISPASGYVPKPGDKVSLEGSDWTLAGATPLNPAGTPLLYTATAKR